MTTFALKFNDMADFSMPILRSAYIRRKHKYNNAIIFKKKHSFLLYIRIIPTYKY